MAQHQFSVFDGDGHVLESDDQLDKYYEGKWKGSRRLDGMTIFPSLDGKRDKFERHQCPRWVESRRFAFVFVAA